MLYFFNPVSDFVIHVLKFLVDDEELSVAVVQYVEEAVSAQGRVSGDRIHADFLRADVYVQVLGAISHHDGNSLTPAAAQRQEEVGYPVRVFVHLPEGEFLILEEKKYAISIYAGFLLDKLGP